MTDETEQTTLQDLFRVMNEMRAEQKELRAEQKDMRSEMNARFDKQDSELSAIRTTVDTLPSFEMVAEIESRQQVIEGDLKAVRSSQNQISGQQRQVMSKIDRAVTRIDRAGIPAE